MGRFILQLLLSGRAQASDLGYVLLMGGVRQTALDFQGAVPALQHPLLKYAGGKSWLVKLLALRLHAHLVNVQGEYIEPFAGSLALGLAIGWPNSVYADTNPDLINLYRSLAVYEKEVADEVDRLRKVSGEKSYYAIRESVWPENLDKISSAERAARTIWLNKNCFLAGSSVLTAREEYKKIEDVQVGEELWNGRVVRQTLKRPYRGEIVSIRGQGSPFTTSMTTDHPVLCTRVELKWEGGSKSDRRSGADLLKNADLVRADTVRVGDWVFLPKEGLSEERVDWTAFWPAVSEFGPQTQERTPCWSNEEDLAWFLGYYAGDGAKNRRDLSLGPRNGGAATEITFPVPTKDWPSTTEKWKCRDELVRIIKDVFDLDAVVESTAGLKEHVQLHSVQVVRFIATLVPGQGWSKDPNFRGSKRLHTVLMNMPTNLQLALLKGWLRADGALKYRERSGAAEVERSTTIKELSLQMYRIAQRCGLRPSWRFVRANGVVEYFVYFGSKEDVSRLDFPVPDSRRRKTHAPPIPRRRFAGRLVAVKVKKLEVTSFDGLVYNVGVDGDHLICVDDVVSHNCFNGLHRYNQRNGHFNVPWGKREDVILPSREHLARVAKLLRPAKISQLDFASALLDAMVADRGFGRLVVFLDPPYGDELQNVSTRGAKKRTGKSAGGVFTGYTNKFTWDDQVRVADWSKFLAKRGALVVATNSWTDKVCDLYREGFALFQVGVQHSVGATGERRGRRAEMLAVSEAYAGVVESIPAKIVRIK